jgi:hypothetical protein
MTSKIDLTIEKLIKSKFRTVENAMKDKRISALLKGGVDISALSRRDKAILIGILTS